MRKVILGLAAATALTAFAATPAAAVTFDTTGSTLACGSAVGCSTIAGGITIGGMNLVYTPNSASTGVPSSINLGTLTLSGSGSADLTGALLTIMVTSTPPGTSGSLPAGSISGTVTGTTSLGSINFAPGGITLGDFFYTVTNSPLSIVSIPSGGVTTIQGFVASVPEPSTWAMMLIGFGAIGFAARRRRSQVLAQVA